MDRPGFSRMDMILETTNDTSLNHFKYRCNCGLCGQFDIAESSLLYRQIEISIMTAGTTRKGKHFREGDPRSQKSNQPMRRSSSKYSLFIYCSLFRSSLRSSTLNLRPGDKT